MPRRGELPDNVAPWSVEPSRVALLLHDMQEFFLRKFPEPTRRALVANCVRLREAGRASGVPIAYTAQPGGMTPGQRGLLSAFWGSGMSRDPADRAVIAELTPAPGEKTITKWRYSAFHASDLAAWLVHNHRDQLVICGVYAHIGVLATALDSFSRDIETFVAADAVADFSAEHHRFALDYAARNCAVVLPTAQLVRALDPAGRGPSGVQSRGGARWAGPRSAARLLPSTAAAPKPALKGVDS